MLYVYEIPIKAGGEPELSEVNKANLIDYIIAGSQNFGFGIFSKRVNGRFIFQVKNDNRKKDKDNINSKRLSSWSLEFVMFFFEAHYSSKQNIANYYKVFEPMYDTIQNSGKHRRIYIDEENTCVTVID